MEKPRIAGEKIVNLCLFLASAFYLAYAFGNYRFGTVRAPKEGFLPAVIGVGATGISAFLTVQAFLGKGDAQNVRFSISWLRFGLLIVASFAYALTMGFVGYLPGTFLFLTAVLLIAKAGGIIKILAISALSSLAFYLIFKVALGVLLPAGFLGV